MTRASRTTRARSSSTRRRHLGAERHPGLRDAHGQDLDPPAPPAYHRHRRRDGQEHSYWHVIPTVHKGMRLSRYRTVIGRIEAPYGHVHFSEARNGEVPEPAPAGGDGPVRRRHAAVGHEPRRRARRPVSAIGWCPGPLRPRRRGRGRDADRDPAPWHDLPVTPALVCWRLVTRSGRVVLGWRTAADFDDDPPASGFGGSLHARHDPEPRSRARPLSRPLLACTG